MVTAFVVYGILGVGALTWMSTRSGGPEARANDSLLADLSTFSRLGLSLVLGLILAAVVIVSTRTLVRRTGWARDLHVSFRALLGPISGAEIAVFALTSGIAEELFFRGALQPAVGYVAASLTFGAIHFGGKKLLSWTLWAVAMGFALGAVFAITGELLGCIVAHVLINYENLHFIAGHDPKAAEPVQAPTAPNLIGARRRAGS